MQPFNFGIRKASADIGGDARNRYHVPSSIYSGGPGPAEEEPPEHTYAAYSPNGLRNAYQEQQPRYNPVSMD